MGVFRAGILSSLSAFLVFGGHWMNAQSEDGSNPNPPPPAAITGQPFSAIKYTRTVRIQPDGRRSITAEGHHVLVARDRDGLITMTGAGLADKPCDVPQLGKLPVCDAWGTFIFDPKAGLMWHWMEGETGDATQMVEIDLRQDQIAEAEQLTSELHESLSHAPEPGISVKDLGERNLQGIKARGLRTTVTHAGPDGGLRLTIHEVWISETMRLVVRVVDGDPQGEETVAGLNHISLAPDPSLFQLPQGRILRHWTNGSGFGAPDIAELSEWPVR